MTCPKCGSREIKISEYDFGTDPQTNYHDTGVIGRCKECQYTIELD